MDDDGDKAGPSSGRPQRFTAQQARNFLQTLISDDADQPSESEIEFSDDSTSDDDQFDRSSESESEESADQPRPQTVLVDFFGPGLPHQKLIILTNWSIFTSHNWIAMLNTPFAVYQHHGS